VWADEGRLEQVILNLLLTAAHALPESQRATNEIRVCVRPGAEGNAVLEVTDNGEGISPDVVPRIFDPFFTTKPPGKGTGLGLSICHGIIASLGGQITVHSIVGEGTTFRVSLPTTDARKGESPPPSNDTPAAPGVRRARVLVVDDEVQLANTLRELLASEHHVVATTSGADALTAIRSGEDFDVVLCDLMMPGMDGMELYEHIRMERPGLERRIVFMTGGAFTATAAEFLGSIENRRVEKPFSLRLVERIVRETRSQRGRSS
jgi:CheY-like chemotaxis protein